MTTKTPEKFIVGETVSFCHGEDRYSVEVIGVDGDEVIANVHGELRIFAPRADGKHVALGEPEFAIMPDMIFHPTQPEKAPFEETLRDRLTDAFDKVLDRILHPFF